MDSGLQEVNVFVKGPGVGRESAIRTLGVLGLKVRSIRDVTPIPHNGWQTSARVEESDEERADTWLDILDLSADIVEQRGPNCSSRVIVATVANARLMTSSPLGLPGKDPRAPLQEADRLRSAVAREAETEKNLLHA